MANRQENEARGAAGKPPRKPRRGRGSIYTYHPSKEHLEALRSGVMPLEVSLGVIERKLDQCKVSISQRVDSGAIALIVRGAEGDWEDAPAVSVWSDRLDRCFRAIGFYLTEVNPDFPEVAYHWEQLSLDF